MRRTSPISPNIAPSEITPQESYLSRRSVLAAGVGLAALQTVGRLGGAALAAAPAALADLTFTRNAAFSTTEAPNSYRDITHLQQLLRIRYRQIRSGAERAESAHAAVECRGFAAKPK